MFKKLNLSLTNIDLNELVGDHRSGYPRFDEYKIKNKDYLNSLIKDKIEFTIPPYGANITKISAPGAGSHTDYWTTALNVYLSAGNDKTYFWENNESATFIEEKGPSYFARKMKPIGSFVAKTGDLYLLNTHVVHSVKMKKTSDPRYILRFIWVTEPFDNVANSIRILE